MTEKQKNWLMATTILVIIVVSALIYVNDYKEHAVLNKQEREAYNTYLQYLDNYRENNSYTKEIADILGAYEFYQNMSYEGEVLKYIQDSVEDDINTDLLLYLHTDNVTIPKNQMEKFKEIVSQDFVLESNKDKFNKIKASQIH
ncbi:hypothetical protein [Bacillus sp. RS11]|uniref:hypothetical protein n=1 Tax=Lysinibacillus sp. RS11 TaxID=3242682 RepID=UPI0035C6AD25